MEFHEMSVEEALAALLSSADGLTPEEAARRLEKDGKNALAVKKRASAAVRFFRQFCDPMIIVLIAAALVSAGFALYERAYADLVDAGVILIIVVINAVIGFVQENRAENALEALREKNKPYAKVLRGGNLLTVPTEELVAGDIVNLEAGDVVPADLRLIFTASLKIEESALTGEAVAAEKRAEAVLPAAAPLGDRDNCAFSGGTVTYGRGAGAVYATGMATQTGKIADMLAEAKEEPSPFSKQLSKTAKILSVAVLAVAVVIFAVSVARDGSAFSEALMTSVAIAVAAIPEGLPAVVTVVLAAGVRKMSKRGAIIKSLSAVETLGCCSVICSDKTGTLTLNKMTVKEAYCPCGDERILKDILSLCNDSRVYGGKITGDPTETALVDYAFGDYGAFTRFTEENPRVCELPFDSRRKLMTVAVQRGDGVYSYTKGAPDELLKRCSRILLADGEAPLGDDMRREISDKNAALAGAAMRVLAAAYCGGNCLKEEDLTFVGLVGMTDPPRPEAKAAVEKCRAAGMKPVMITGDHLATARAIAAELDILREGDLSATGADVDNTSDEELAKNVNSYSVFARVSPENKLRIVRAIRSRGEVVAMTGDGVNDAPSLKEADIGIGMGITGTQVAKEASDAVLTDDNFATIVSAVEEGRRIYSNVIKAVQFLLSANIAEVLCLFIASVILGVQFLTPVMILWINLITDSFPALALGAEKAEKNVMSLPPRKGGKSLFAGVTGRDTVIEGIFQTALVMLSFALGQYALGSHGEAMTMAFVSLCFIQLFHAFNLRSQTGSIFGKNPFSNVYLDISALVGVLLTLVAVLVPWFNGLFGTSPLDLKEWLTAAGVAAAIIPLTEILKLSERALSRRKRRPRA